MTYTPPSGTLTAIDLWRFKFYPLNTDGTVKAPGYPIPAAEAYNGLELQKGKSFQPNLGAPRTIPVVSQGRVQTTFILPSIEAKTAEAHLAYIDLDTFAELTKVKARTFGGARMMAAGTNKQGLELSGALLVSQLQSHDLDGLDVWSNYLLPRVKIAITWPAFNENPTDVTLTMSLSAAKKHVWGTALTESDDGATEFTLLPFQTWGLPNIVAWVADGAEDTFVLPANDNANDTFADTFLVYDSTSGTAVTGTPAAGQFVAGAAPTSDHILLGWYEQIEG